MKRNTFVVLFFFSFALIFTEESLSILSFEYPPIYQNSFRKGLACDLVIEAYKSVGIDVNIIFYPVQRMISQIYKNDNVCCIGGTILFTDKDKNVDLLFSDPFMYVVQTFIYDSKKYKTGISYNSLNDLQNYRIGVLNASGIMKFLQQNSELELIPNNIHIGSAKQLVYNFIDLWAIVDLTGLYYLKEIEKEKSSLFKTTTPYKFGDISVVFSKNHDRGLYYYKKYIEGMRKIKDNGKYMEIMAFYYGSYDKINKNALAYDMR